MRSTSSFFLSVAVMLIAGCRTAPPPDPGVAATAQALSPEVSLRGRWLLTREPPPPGPGIRMEIEVDSVSASRVFGRLSSYFAGDVGGDPASFPRFEGSLDSLGRVTIRIGPATGDAEALVLEGTAGNDSIPLDLFVIGPDTATVPGMAWWLVRSR